MAKLKGSSRSKIKPTVVKKGNPDGIAKTIRTFREKLKESRERLRQRRERLGRERIAQEKIALKREQEQVIRLEEEARVEAEREKIAQQRIQAQRSLREVERARRERKLAPIRAVGRRARQVIVAGAEAIGEAPSRRKKPRRRKPQREESGFFGIQP